MKHHRSHRVGFCKIVWTFSWCLFRRFSIVNTWRMTASSRESETKLSNVKFGKFSPMRLGHTTVGDDTNPNNLQNAMQKTVRFRFRHHLFALNAEEVHVCGVVFECACWVIIAKGENARLFPLLRKNWYGASIRRMKFIEWNWFCCYLMNLREYSRYPMYLDCGNVRGGDCARPNMQCIRICVFILLLCHHVNSFFLFLTEFLLASVCLCV